MLQPTPIQEAPSSSWSIVSRIICALIMLRVVPTAALGIAGNMLDDNLEGALANAAIIVGMFPALVFLFRGRGGLQALSERVVGILLAILVGGVAYALFMDRYEFIRGIWPWALIGLVAMIAMERFGTAIVIRPAESSPATKSASLRWSIINRVFVAWIMLGAIPLAIVEFTEVMSNRRILDAMAGVGIIVGFIPALVFLLRGRTGVRAVPAGVCWILLALMASGSLYSIFLAPESVIQGFWAWALIAMVGIVAFERFGAAEPNAGAGAAPDKIQATVAVAERENNPETLSRVLLGVQAAGIGLGLAGFLFLMVIGLTMGMGGPNAEMDASFWLVILAMLGDVGVFAAMVPAAVFVFKGRKGLAATSWAWLQVAVAGLASMVVAAIMIHPPLAAGLIFLVAFLCHLVAERWYSAKTHR